MKAAMRFKKSKLFLALMATGGMSGITIPQMAQAVAIEEVVVTARKREEGAQDVPVAVSAVTGMDVENAFTLDVTSVSQFAPNVIMDTIEAGTPAGGGFSIRGVSYQDVEKAFDPTVLIAVDDVPLSTGTGNVFDLLDIERIEVLRGPQGTLFGKNVMGGLINIIRTKPQLNETSGKIRARVGEYDKQDLDVLYNYGSDTWAVKLTAATLNQGEGYTESHNSGDLGKKDTTRGGVHLLWQPSDTFTGEVALDYSNMEGKTVAHLATSTPGQDAFCGIYAAYGYTCSDQPGEPIGGDRNKSYANWDGDVGLEKTSAMTRLTADLTDDYSLMYIGSFMTANDQYQADMDGVGATIYHVDRWGDFKQFTHEVRLSRDAGDALTWQAGVFSSSTDANSFQLSQAFSVTWTPFEDTVTSGESHSIFAEGDYRMMDDKLVWTLGARYISETKRMSRTVTDPGSGATLAGPNAGGERTDNDWIYRWGVRYSFTDDFMLYFTNSTGFRSGGFSPRASTPDVLGEGFGPETLTNWEIGAKTTWLDGLLQVNATLFHMIYEDMQIEVSLPANNVANQNQLAIRNVGEAELNGAELEVQALLTDFWRLSGNVGYLDAEYKDFEADLYGDGIIADETSLDLRRAPKLTYSIQSVMDFAVGDGTLMWRVGYSWRDDYEGTLTNHPGTTVEAFGLLDSSISYDIENWKFAIFGRNLTDEDAYSHDYIVSPSRSGDSSLWRFSLPRPPREIGAEVSYSF